MATPQRLQSGFRLEDGNTLNSVLASPMWQTNYGITALAGGALSSSTPILVLGSNVVSTVASDGDSVVLPSAVAGSIVYMLNADAAQSVLVYGNGSDTINGTAGSTGVSYAAAKRVMFIAVTNGVWIANVLAAS
jgi:hypothetical protein